MRIEILKGKDATATLSDPAFLGAWDALSRRCPWTTVFQSSAFAATWYGIYRDTHDPLLVVSRPAAGALDGLLPLAVARDDGRVVAAGELQAEYQTWIADPAAAETFPRAALEALCAGTDLRTAGSKFSLYYLPPGVPMNWLPGSPLGKMSKLEVYSRPLLLLSSPKVDKSLSKKSNKSRLNRLAALGPIRVERVTDPARLEALQDRIARIYDTRQSAAHGVAFFAADPLKKAFLVALLRAGALHATILWAGDHLAAAHLGAADARTVHLGDIVHDPELESHSPGKLHMLLLAKLLREEGVEIFDLTPGGDPYKDRFADHHDQVARFTILLTAAERMRAAARDNVISIGRTVLRAFGLTPEHVRRWLRRSK